MIILKENFYMEEDDDSDEDDYSNDDYTKEYVYKYLYNVLKIC